MGRTRLVQSVALMMFAAVIGKALLVIREPIIAAYFGASAQTDAYNVAMTIATMLISVTISPIGSVLVPVYVERLNQSREGGERFIHQVLTLYLLILSSVLLVGYFAAPWLVRLYAPGFAPETTALAVHLARILSLFAVVSGMAGYLSTVLTAHNKFFWIAMGPIATATMVIVVLSIAAPKYGIDALAWGVVAGNLVQTCLLGIFTWRVVRPGLNFRFGETVRALGKLSSWMLVGRFVGQGNNLIDRNMLSYLSEGSIAALGFARSVYLLPFNIFSTGITRVIITNFSWDAARGDIDALKRDLALSIRMAAFFTIPISIGMVVLSTPIVRFFYQRGAFTATDAAVTSSALSIFALWLFPQSVNFIVVRVYLALKYVSVSAIMGSLALLGHWGLNLLLIPRFGLVGVVWAQNIPQLFGVFAAFLYLRYRVGPLGLYSLIRPLITIVGASAVMGFIVYLGGQRIVLVEGHMAAISLLALVVVGFGIYISILHLFRFRDLVLITNMVSKSLRDRLP